MGFCLFNNVAVAAAALADRGERVPRGAAQWTLPYGVHHAAANYGPQVVAHMAKYGTTTMPTPKLRPPTTPTGATTG